MSFFKLIVKLIHLHGKLLKCEKKSIHENVVIYFTNWHTTVCIINYFYIHFTNKRIWRILSKILKKKLEINEYIFLYSEEFSYNFYDITYILVSMRLVRSVNSTVTVYTLTVKQIYVLCQRCYVIVILQ